MFGGIFFPVLMLAACRSKVAPPLAVTQLQCLLNIPLTVSGNNVVKIRFLAHLIPITHKWMC
jgi:hypothetical protein